MTARTGSRSTVLEALFSGVRGECLSPEECSWAEERHQDCQWIQGLHSVGLLRGLFRPAAEIVALRAYLRHRAALLEYRAAHIQHMQKALQQMNVQLTQVLTDITGVTGLAMIRAIVAGERNPSICRLSGSAIVNRMRRLLQRP